MDPIPYSCQEITEGDIAAVNQVLRSAHLTQGPQVEKFEEELKERFNVNHAVCCSSGTAALHLAYASIEIDRRSIGFVPAVTFSATANAYRYQGADVVFCDINPETGIIDLNHLQEQLVKFRDASEGVCAISPVSFAGKVAPLIAVKKLAKSFDCRLIEDASHSPGGFSESNDGSLIFSVTSKSLDAACISFHPVKHICAGEGGVVLTNCDKIAWKAKHLRSHGITRPFTDDHPTPWYYQQNNLGWNYRLSDIHAALGRSQLKRLDAGLKARKKIASKYNSIFLKKPFSDVFTVPHFENGNSWHLYIIRFKQAGVRDRVHKYLKSKGVMTQIHYTPLYKHPYFQKVTESLSLPGAEKFFASCLSIPMFPTLNNAQQDHVIDCLELFIKSET